MTALVCFKYSGNFIALSDTLLSAQVDMRDDKRFIPTMANLPEAIDHYPSGHAQKLIVISPDLLFGWSGSKPLASAICKFVRANHSSFTSATDCASAIEAKFNIDDNFGLLICYQREGKLDIFTGGFCMEESGIPPFEFSAWAGRGGGDLLGRICKMGSDIPDAANGLDAALGFLGIVESQFIRSGTGLENLWGGPFEMVYVDETGFTKGWPETNLYQWTVLSDTEKEEQIVHLPKFLYKKKYINDVLVLKFLDPIVSRNNSISLIPPVDSPGNPQDILDADNGFTDFQYCDRAVHIVDCHVNGSLVHKAVVPMTGSESLKIISEMGPGKHSKFSVNGMRTLFRKAGIEEEYPNIESLRPNGVTLTNTNTSAKNRRP